MPSSMVTIFLANEKLILKGTFDKSLLENCKFEAQINDVLKISEKKIYKSKDAIENEVTGYKIITDLLDVFIKAINNKYDDNVSNFDLLILNILPK